MAKINIKGKNILLIGGAGFIGHNLALTLKSNGANVEICDPLQVNNLISLHNADTNLLERPLYIDIIHERLKLLREAAIPIHTEDARDYFRLSLLFEKTKPDIVILLAAVSHSSRSNKDPYSTFDHSFRTLENALDCSRGRIKHFIYFSSSMVYGNFKSEFVTEDVNCEPLGIYGALKYGGEKLVIAYKQVFNLPYTIIRPSALYGERCISRRIGQIFIENALRGNNLNINGDGKETLDFTYIDDLVDGIQKCITNTNAYNQIFNLTYGKAMSLNDMAKIIQSEFDNIEVIHKERDNLVPKRGTLDITKANKLIDYCPANNLEVGYRKYINWYKEFSKKSVGFNQKGDFLPQSNE